jgi:hypothetical protein
MDSESGKSVRLVENEHELLISKYSPRNQQLFFRGNKFAQYRNAKLILKCSNPRFQG